MQTIASLNPIRQIMSQSLARYATITPQGIILPVTTAVYNPLPATIITYKPARTRYLNRKPICRSLDGARSLDRAQSCVTCRGENYKSHAAVLNRVM